MSEQKDSLPNGTDPVGQLIRYAGAREPVAAERFERAKQRVGAHWQSVVADERRLHGRLRYRALAAAAGLVIAVGAGLLLWREATPPVSAIATIAQVVGEVRIDGDPAVVGDRVATRATIETTAHGRVAIRLDSGHSLRIDRGSRLLATAADRFELAHGGVYVDSGPDGAHGPVHVQTTFGIASDLGTQFQLRSSAGTLEIGVREGLVELSRDGAASLTIPAGTLRRLSGAGEGVELALASTAPYWSWVESVPADFTIEGATLAQYLAWYARERGLALYWDGPASEENAMRIHLRGSIQGLSLEEGLKIVSSIAEFRYALTAAAIQVTVD